MAGETTFSEGVQLDDSVQHAPADDISSRNSRMIETTAGKRRQLLAGGDREAKLSGRGDSRIS